MSSSNELFLRIPIAPQIQPQFIPRLGNHNMSSEYLGLSGLVTNSEQLAAHVNATYATGNAIQAQRLHTTKYLYGHKIAFRRHKTDDMTKRRQGDLGGAIVRKCQIGMLNDLDSSGPGYINGTLMENCNVAVSVKTGGSFSVNNSAIVGSQQCFCSSTLMRLSKTKLPMRLTCTEMAGLPGDNQFATPPSKQKIFNFLKK